MLTPPRTNTAFDHLVEAVGIVGDWVAPACQLGGPIDPLNAPLSTIEPSVPSPATFLANPVNPDLAADFPIISAHPPKRRTNPLCPFIRLKEFERTLKPPQLPANVVRSVACIFDPLPLWLSLLLRFWLRLSLSLRFWLRLWLRLLLRL